MIEPFVKRTSELPFRTIETIQSIIGDLRSQIKTGDRNRGHVYFNSRLVRDLDIDDSGTFATAEVQGSEPDPYQVTLDLFDNDEIQLHCDCARFRDGHFCKHVWAVLLELENKAGPTRQRKRVSTKKKQSPTQKHRETGTTPEWQKLISKVQVTPYREELNFSVIKSTTEPKTSSERIYVLDLSSRETELLTMRRSENRSGQTRIQSIDLTDSRNNEPVNPVDLAIANGLIGCKVQPNSYYYSGNGHQFRIPHATSHSLWDLLVSSRRLYWTLNRETNRMDDLLPIQRNEIKHPVQITPVIIDDPKRNGTSTMTVALCRGDEVIDNTRVVALEYDREIALLTDEVTALSNPKAIEFWISAHRLGTPVNIQLNERAAFLQSLLSVPGIDNVSLPDSWKISTSESLQPKPRLNLLVDKNNVNDLNACVWFIYGEQTVRAGSPATSIFDEGQAEVLTRDMAFERAKLETLDHYPLSIAYDPNGEREIDFTFKRRNLIRIVDELGALGWEVVLENSPVRHAGSIDIQVVSDQDWFDLSANVDFQGESISLPSLLKAVKAKANFIRLADGSHGRLPDELIKKYARLADVGTIVDDTIRFQPTQAMLLDAMLDNRDKVSFDKKFQATRKKLQSFRGIKPKNPGSKFKGTLREYQRDGLGWLNFLREFGFGGCLADDMGLGKTIQVLALLDSRRTRRKVNDESKSNSPKKAIDKKTSAAKTLSKTRSKTQKLTTENLSQFVKQANQQPRKPTIIVVPKSLIFNWIEEAARFTPLLRILDYTGGDRLSRANDGKGFDVLLTTYGLLQKDIADISKIEFDYAILDESQAIKNSKTLCAKATRLIRADHRLAMTGTPIENHLGELWSLFEFLNPGMLGGSNAFAKLLNQKKASERERKGIARTLSKGLQPFILRRTKQQVLTELPEKSEQTLHCDMTLAQKKKYDELKEYYRVKLTKKIETEGIGKTKIHVLEALLRLRQVACDPRLIDPDSKPGAKLELLHQQVSEVVGEGHKVLIFSQFTSLLGLVRQQFDQSGIRYEYLDGKTTNRQKRVKHFQEDNSISAFLISLKAGGSGLNLTAADYVYLLDPWWNPAVEAQAIDRAHRIGQQRSVMAYRIVCNDTVEEKIIELQETKRELANSIIRADQSLIKSMTADDLSRLLS